MSKAVLSQLNLVARDPDATVAFYRALGLENGFGLDFDSPALARVYDDAWRRAEGDGTRCVIGFSLARRYAIVADPDGNHVGLMSPVDASRRAPPPAPPPTL